MQNLALKQLREVENYSEGTLEIVEVCQPNAQNLNLVIKVSISCHEFDLVPGGLQLRARELFYIYVHPEFPYEYPRVYASHNHFEGQPHVQWRKSLCLYRSSTEWNPSDGMFGFMERLYKWLKDGAANNLDSFGGPLHPPVAYCGNDCSIVIKPNTPEFNDLWVGTAELTQINATTYEIQNWFSVTEQNYTGLSAAVFLLSEEFPFEYPNDMSKLFNLLDSSGVTIELFLLGLQCTSVRNSEDDPLFIVIGTPQRGVKGGVKQQHLSVWKIEGNLRKCLSLSTRKISKYSEPAKLGKEAEELFLDWLKETKISWCAVMEDRPEIVNARDGNTNLKKFTQKKIILLGCGALGSYIAKALVRGGNKDLTLIDKGKVNPGIVCRQEFYQQDIGTKKVSATKKELERIFENVDIQIFDFDITKEIDKHIDEIKNADLIIDATASNLVSHKIENLYLNHEMPTIASVALAHDCSRALAIYKPSNLKGGTKEALRSLKLKLRAEPQLKEFYDEFWPDPPRAKIFQPEPGCSEPTFEGSIADVSFFASWMLKYIANNLDCAISTNALCINSNNSVTPNYQGYKFLINDFTELQDEQNGFKVRLSKLAEQQIKSLIKSSTRRRGAKKETGGILLGEFDEVLKLIWVDFILDAPTDSEFSEQSFICGTRDVDENIRKLKKESKGALNYLGTWHTHPISAGEPSEKDLSAAYSLLHEFEKPRRFITFIIIGFSSDKPEFKVHVFNRDQLIISTEDQHG